MNKPAVIIIFLILIVIMLFLFAIPKYQEYRGLQSTMMAKQAQYSGESIYFARVSDILSGLQSRQEALGKIQNALPDGFTLGPLMDFLQKKGSENAISITSVVFAQASPLALPETPAITAGQAQDVLFTVNAAGSYQGLKNFLFAMDNSARLFEMDSVSFSKTEGALSSRGQEYTMKLEVRTHAY